jgi:hypothetical protein
MCRHRAKSAVSCILLLLPLVVCLPSPNSIHLATSCPSKEDMHQRTKALNKSSPGQTAVKASTGFRPNKLKKQLLERSRPPIQQARGGLRFRAHPMIVRRNLLLQLSSCVLLLLPLVVCLPSPNSIHLATSCPSKEGMRLRGGGLPSTKALNKVPVASEMEAKSSSFPALVQQIGIVIAMVLITIFSRPSTLTPIGGSPSIQHVFHYGWVAALSTGLGALPLLFMGKVISDLLEPFSKRPVHYIMKQNPQKTSDFSKD